MKYGILLTTFGSFNLYCKVSFLNFESQVQKCFPTIPIRWAFTSNALKKQNIFQDEKIGFLDEVLSKMAFEQFTHIAVQPLQVIAGMEYSVVVSKIKKLGERLGFYSILVGEPLITGSIHSIERVKEAIFSVIPYKRKQTEPVIFMGHGNKSIVKDEYKTLSMAVRNNDPLVFIGTMDGSYRLEHILSALENVLHTVWLMPFFTIVGKHVLEDMVGGSLNSWQSRLEAAGFSCIPILKGLLDNKAFSDIWLEHLKRVITNLSNTSN